MKLSLLFLFCLATSAFAQSDFHAYAGTEVLIEGGRIEKLSAVYNNASYNIRAPKGWYRQVDNATRKIIFMSTSGKSAITIRFSTNSPGVLPETDILRAEACQAHPGADILQTSVCPTSYRPGVFFEFARMPVPRCVQRIRHAYVPQQAGMVEFVLTASDDEFSADSTIFMSVLRDFRKETTNLTQK